MEVNNMLTNKEILYFAGQLPAGVKIIDMRDVNGGTNINFWDFIEKFHPRYYSCDEILFSNDLEKLIGREDQENDNAGEIYNGIAERLKTNDDLAIKLEAQSQLRETYLSIYEHSINGFIKKIK